MGPLGVQEMIVIFLVALVLFGPKKLPELGKTIAKAMTEFRRAQSDLKATYEREMQAIERGERIAERSHPASRRGDYQLFRCGFGGRAQRLLQHRYPQRGE